MTEKAPHPAEPELVDQYIMHTTSILNGERPKPIRAVMVEFFDGKQASAAAYGMGETVCAKETLAQVLAAIHVLSDVAVKLNAQASN